VQSEPKSARSGDHLRTRAAAPVQELNQPGTQTEPAGAAGDSNVQERRVRSEPGPPVTPARRDGAAPGVIRCRRHETSLFRAEPFARDAFVEPS